MRFLRWVVLGLVVGQVADLLTTAVGLARDASEVNLFVVLLLGHGGWMAVALYKIGIVVVATGIVRWLHVAQMPRWMQAVAIGISVGLPLLAAGSNAIQLMRS